MDVRLMLIKLRDATTQIDKRTIILAAIKKLRLEGKGDNFILYYLEVYIYRYIPKSIINDEEGYIKLIKEVLKENKDQV